jgi:catechol 2,3-dioxygenase-like lactoylglutathione lyase family enzyme
MAIQRMEHVGIVVDDLAAATEFFVELGLVLQGEGPVEGRWVDRVVGLELLAPQRHPGPSAIVLGWAYQPLISVLDSEVQAAA